MMNRPVVIKWKYKVNHPQNSDDNITGYIDYISSQVRERRESSGRFLVNGEGNYLGKEPELNDSSSVSEVERYINYMDSRIGSHELFSSKDADIDEIVKNEKTTKIIPLLRDALHGLLVILSFPASDHIR